MFKENVLFYRKEHEKVKKNISEFLDTIVATYDLLLSAVEAHLSGADQDAFKPFKTLVMEKESEADDLRRKIERLLYKKSLLPELRKDILLTINQLDRLPDLAETIVKSIFQLGLKLPDFLVKQERELLSLGLSTVNLVTRLTQEVFKENRNVEELVNLIDQQESLGDHLEDEMITALFRSDEVSGFDKILIREVILQIGNVLDLCQTSSDYLMVISIKRHV